MSSPLMLSICARFDVRSILFFSSRRRHTRFDCDWSSDVCSSDLSGTGTTLCGHTNPEFIFSYASGVGPVATSPSLSTTGTKIAYVENDPNIGAILHRSEERRVGKECRSRWSPYH